MHESEAYIVAAVEVSRALRFYTALASQKAACEKELAQQGLRVLVWGEGLTEEDAMAQAMQQAALAITLRSMDD